MIEVQLHWSAAVQGTFRFAGVPNFLFTLDSLSRKRLGAGGSVGLRRSRKSPAPIWCRVHVSGFELFGVGGFGLGRQRQRVGVRAG